MTPENAAAQSSTAEIAARSAESDIARLDVDDLDSILLALGQLPTWFPETVAKVSKLRADLIEARDGLDRDVLADVLTEAHLRRDGYCGETHYPEADFVIERYNARRREDAA